jgi:hypothetical protein
MPPLLFAAINFSKDESTQWVVLCVGVLATCYLIMRGRAKANKQKDPFTRPAAFGVSQQKQIERDMSGLMVEMLETARHMAAQLDTRAAKLELLMKEADAKLAALKSASASAPAAAAVQRVEKISHSTSAADDAEAITPSSAAPVTPAVVPDAPQMKPETPPDPRHGEIYALADQGRSPQEIARQLDRPNGEVELILALRSR